MERQVASPLTSLFTSDPSRACPTKSHRPSTSTASGSSPRPSRARWAATFCATDMPRPSHSSWLAWPTAHATHQAASLSNSRSRSASVRALESRTR